MSKIAFIFPGQGAQTTGMGQDFYQETETGRGMFEKASENLGFSMTDLCFDPAQTDRLNITEYTQPAMVTASLAMMRVFMERTGIRPDVAAGLTNRDFALHQDTSLPHGTDGIFVRHNACSRHCRILSQAQARSHIRACRLPTITARDRLLSLVRQRRLPRQERN